ncbi:hypothetical protein LTR37_003329 [Vermiconidia calcicola]|uniref:Uncharacterized protein n=1 Tax=Vermiconidia calcicola TaxID=1690605 RepID=A0ACC3NQG0_9PEZI|nr:hypothetical protein LTR37_003329 [Vermiconidia calcicola]
MRAVTATAAPLRQAFSNLAGPACRRSFATSSRLDAGYGFIGLGRMGFPMAKNLRAKIPESDTMVIHDVNPAVTESFAKEVGNVEIAKNVREVAEKTNVFHQILKPPTLATESPRRHERLFIDCSTIDPRTSSEVANATHSSQQGKFVDAPMSGGVVGAAAGTLTFMVGAPADGIDRVREVLSLMGSRVIHLGPPTSGLKGKLANNYLLALNNIATCEAMNMGIKWGLDGQALADMINSATGKCWPSEANNPVPGVVPNAPAGKDYQGGFGTSLMLKDLGLALTACAQADIVPRLGPYAKDIYAAADGAENCKGRDFSVVYRYLGGKE